MYWWTAKKSSGRDDYMHIWKYIKQKDVLFSWSILISQKSLTNIPCSWQCYWMCKNLMVAVTTHPILLPSPSPCNSHTCSNSSDTYVVCLCMTSNYNYPLCLCNYNVHIICLVISVLFINKSCRLFFSILVNYM